MKQAEKELQRITSSLMAISIVAKKLARELVELKQQMIEDEMIELLGEGWRDNPEYEFLT